MKYMGHKIVQTTQIKEIHVKFIEERIETHRGMKNSFAFFFQTATLTYRAEREKKKKVKAVWKIMRFWKRTRGIATGDDNFLSVGVFVEFFADSLKLVAFFGASRCIVKDAPRM